MICLKPRRKYKSTKHNKKPQSTMACDSMLYRELQEVIESNMQINLELNQITRLVKALVGYLYIASAIIIALLLTIIL